MADLFNDGFESGDLTAWDASSIDGGDLSAHADAALHGNYGLKCFIDDTTDIKVNDNTPNAETRYRARYYIDPNTISMANDDFIQNLLGYSLTNSSMFKVYLNYSSADGYRIYFAISKDAGYEPSSYHIISDAPHCIEVDWKASSAPGADDGFLSLWIDGVLKETIANVDNDTHQIDLITLGAREISSGISGTFYLDDFASNDDGSEIGRISEGNFFMFLSTMWEKHKEIWRPNKKILIPDLI